MTSPCDRDGLWMKAKAHVNRSFAARDSGEFEEAALWAASALELLAKAALAKVSPLLVADPLDDGKSLLVAAGLSADVARFKSIPAKAVFSRCARAFPPFNEQEAARIAKMRNEELHSALSPFTGVDEEGWWQRYWAQAVLLVDAQDETVRDLVGSVSESVVEDHLARNSENVKRRVRTMLERARRRWELAATSRDAAAEIAQLVSRTGFDGDFHGTTQCPACGEPGRLQGDYVEDSEVEYDYEDGTALELLTVLSEAFECDTCGLRLVGAEYVTAAGLPEQFDDHRDYEPEWDDYGND